MGTYMQGALCATKIWVEYPKPTHLHWTFHCMWAPEGSGANLL